MLQSRFHICAESRHELSVFCCLSPIDRSSSPPFLCCHCCALGSHLLQADPYCRKPGLCEALILTRLHSDLGFGGKSKSLYGREGHQGITLMKYGGDQSGLKEAVRLAEFFEKENHGRRDWSLMQSLTSSGKDDENNPNLVKVDPKTGEKERIFYGYLATVSDLDKIDTETRKKAVIESMRELFSQ